MLFLLLPLDVAQKKKKNLNLSSLSLSPPLFSAAFKGAFNELVNVPRVYTPAETAVQTPNSDTPYSFCGLDLRESAVAITVPEIDEGRYWSAQLIDAYTHNAHYLGSRTTGNGGGKYLLVGPNWKGGEEDENEETAKSFDKVLRFETNLALILFRTQLFDPEDLPNVVAVQSGYKLELVDEGAPLPLPRPKDWPKPLTAEKQKASIEFFEILDFVLQFCPPPTEEEKKFRARMSSVLGLSGDPAKPFKVSSASPELASALEEGIAKGWESFAKLKAQVDAGKLQSDDCFGTREFLAADALGLEHAVTKRMLAAVVGIYGNTKDEAIYPCYFVDSSGEKLDGSKHSYALRFEGGENGGLPPVNAFWSATMYKLPESLLYANEIDRYLINSPMLPSLIRDGDDGGGEGEGGITIDISHSPPADDRRRANWLPAPPGPFAVFLRLYWPKEEALNGEWTRPELVAKPL